MTKVDLANLVGCSICTINRIHNGLSVTSLMHARVTFATEGAVNPPIRERGNLTGHVRTFKVKRTEYPGLPYIRETLEYKLWCRMRAACLGTSKRYKPYRELGITMCPEWSNFLTFLKDMGKIPTGFKSIFLSPKSLVFEKASCVWVREARGRPSRHKKRQIKDKVVYSYPKKNKALNGLLKLVQMQITEKSEVIWN